LYVRFFREDATGIYTFVKKTQESRNGKTKKNDSLESGKTAAQEWLFERNFKPSIKLLHVNEFRDRNFTESFRSKGSSMKKRAGLEYPPFIN